MKKLFKNCLGILFVSLLFSCTNEQDLFENIQPNTNNNQSKNLSYRESGTNTIIIPSDISLEDLTALSSNLEEELIAEKSYLKGYVDHEQKHIVFTKAPLNEDIEGDNNPPQGKVVWTGSYLSCKLMHLSLLLNHFDRDCENRTKVTPVFGAWGQILHWQVTNECP